MPTSTGSRWDPLYLRSTRVEYVTSLDPEEVRARLKRPASPEHPVLAWRFGPWTTLRRVIWGRNSWLPTLSVVVQPSADGGTRLRTRLGAPGSTRLFTVVWFTFLPAVLIQGLRQREGAASWLQVGSAAALLVFFAGLAAMANRSRSAEERWLREGFEDLLDAQPLDSPR